MSSATSRVAGAAGDALGMAWRGAAIARHLKRVDPRRLAQFARRVRLVTGLLTDVGSRRYRRVPWKTVGALSAALAYFLLPVDAVPDVIPLSGFLDDALVLGMVFGAAESDLRAYCAWAGVDPTPYFGTDDVG
ncbi:MAG: YkvA family protein [Deltaproteobacteria bacterium]|nr:YkvA family protein [Deltaproteobacteria bacterium]